MGGRRRCEGASEVGVAVHPSVEVADFLLPSTRSSMFSLAFLLMHNARRLVTITKLDGLTSQRLVGGKQEDVRRAGVDWNAKVGASQVDPQHSFQPLHHSHLAWTSLSLQTPLT